MGRMQIVLDDETETQLRECASLYFGFKKGNLSKLVEEAVKEWAKKHRK